MFHARDGSCFVQVEQSSFMRWEAFSDDAALTIDEGFVAFRRYKKTSESITREDLQAASQPTFLSYLMLGLI